MYFLWTTGAVLLLVYVLLKVRFYITKPKFHGQTVWITGASSGIGEEFALAFARAGASLILTSRNSAELSRVQQLCLKHTAKVDIYPMDLSKPHEALYAAKQLTSRYEVDILVNNAGVSQRAPLVSTLDSMDLERQLFNLNCLGAVALTKAVLPNMIRRKRGQIVLVSSIAALIESPLRCMYSSSKSAVSAYMESLRSEVWRHNITVTSLFPGFVQTNIANNALGADGVRLHSRDLNNSQGMTVEALVRRAMRHIYFRHEDVLVAQTKLVAAFWLGKCFPCLWEAVSPRVCRRMECAYRKEN